MSFMRDARRLLDESGVPYEFVMMRKHYGLVINGKRVLVLSKGNSTGRDLGKVHSAINAAHRLTPP